MNATSEKPGSSRDPEQLERSAERLRADLDRTLDALERKLSPSQLLDKSIAYLRDHGGEMAYAVGDSVRRNPVPILLTVAGIGWLIATAVRTRAPIDVTPAAVDLDDVADLDDELADESLDDDSSYSETYSPRSRFRDGIAAARARTRRAQYRAMSALEERPLLLGGLAVAVGALLGALIPSTEYEDKVVGQMRDRAVERAKQMGEAQYQNLRSRFDNPDLEVSGQAH
jgi:ElaB/YqjD/DUF883 family membrane-anchored ribosome-binding protein